MQDDENRDDDAPVDFRMEYDALEYLLVAIIDAYPHPTKDRRTRLRDAYENLIGVRIDRVDEPDSDISQAMFEYARLEEETFDNQVLPEFGGPERNTPEDQERLKERTPHHIAQEVAEMFEDRDPTGNLPEYIYKRAMQSYRNKLIRGEPVEYAVALRDRYSDYNPDTEQQIYHDLTEVQRILDQYQIAMDLDRPFWRLKG
jgi:hypothetical protein